MLQLTGKITFIEGFEEISMCFVCFSEKKGKYKKKKKN